MNATGTRNLLAVAGLLVVPMAGAEPIGWSSTFMGTNLTSSGQDMDGGFQFQLGAFSGGFIPTAANLSEWATYWVPVQSTSYVVSVRWYNSQYVLTSNAAPFSVGAKAYVWGRGPGAGKDEWILFRGTTWTWPAANPNNPPSIKWTTPTANETIFGSVNTSNTPFVMKSAAVYSFAQWQSTELAGEPLNAPNDDPDHDGMSNLLEFIYGTSPILPGAPVQTPLVMVNGSAQISVPRLANRRAKLTVEVSPDLVTWSSGTTSTTVVESTATSLVVRDLTPVDAAHPKRFIRLKVEPATP